MSSNNPSASNPTKSWHPKIKSIQHDRNTTYHDGLSVNTDKLSRESSSAAYSFFTETKAHSGENALAYQKAVRNHNMLTQHNPHGSLAEPRRTNHTEALSHAFDLSSRYALSGVEVIFWDFSGNFGRTTSILAGELAEEAEEGKTRSLPFALISTQPHYHSKDADRYGKSYRASVKCKYTSFHSLCKHSVEECTCVQAYMDSRPAALFHVVLYLGDVEYYLNARNPTPVQMRPVFTAAFKIDVMSSAHHWDIDEATWGPYRQPVLPPVLTPVQRIIERMILSSPGGAARFAGYIAARDARVDRIQTLRVNELESRSVFSRAEPGDAVTVHYVPDDHLGGVYTHPITRDSSHLVEYFNRFLYNGNPRKLREAEARKPRGSITEPNRDELLMMTRIDTDKPGKGLNALDSRMITAKAQCAGYQHTYDLTLISFGEEHVDNDSWMRFSKRKDETNDRDTNTDERPESVYKYEPITRAGLATRCAAWIISADALCIANDALGKFAKFEVYIDAKKKLLYTPAANSLVPHRWRGVINHIFGKDELVSLPYNSALVEKLTVKNAVASYDSLSRNLKSFREGSEETGTRTALGSALLACVQAHGYASVLDQHA